MERANCSERQLLLCMILGVVGRMWRVGVTGGWEVYGLSMAMLLVSVLKTLRTIAHGEFLLSHATNRTQSPSSTKFDDRGLRHLGCWQCVWKSKYCSIFTPLSFVSYNAM